MDRPSSTPDREFAPSTPKAPVAGANGWSPRAIFISLRTQLISGLIFTLPIVITFWIVYWIFLTLERFLLNPVAYVIHLDAATVDVIFEAGPVEQLPGPAI